jgi:hypothetical protein
MSPSRNPRERGHFVCDRCGGYGNLSIRQYKDNKKLSRPCLCKPCRDQRNRKTCSDSAHHGERATVNREAIRINGCTLFAHYRGRCRDYLTCPSYHECLTVVADRNWSGWTSI